MANWYAFTGWNVGGNPFDPTKYRLVSVKPLCIFGEHICAVYLNEESTTPSTLGSNIETYISNALATQIPQPMGSGVKRFVYLRGPIS